MPSMTVSGKCLCGAVAVIVPIDKPVFDACHCGMCRKWSGSPALTISAGGPVKFTGEANIGVFDSSAWAQRGFCKTCGTHLFYRLKRDPLISLPLGLFDGTDRFEFHQQIFIDKKPACYAFANKTAEMTEAEVFAKFAPP